MKNTMKRRAIALATAAMLVTAACGSGDDEAGTDGADAATASPDTTLASAPPEESTAEADTADDGADTAEGDGAESESGDTESEAADGADGTESDGTEELERLPIDPPVLAATPQVAGPITVTPTICATEGYEFVRTDDGNESMGIAGNRLFAVNDDGVIGFQIDSSAGCTLRLDTELAPNGVLVASDEFTSASGTPSGQLLISGIFGAKVFDLEAGLFYDCDDLTGNASISPDGTQALTRWGLGPVTQWSLTGTTCTGGEELAFPDDDHVKFVAFDGADLLVGSEGLDETVYASRYVGGAPAWRVGNPEIGELGWWGWVHGMAPCGAYTCLIDTNTDNLTLIGADGTLIAEFNFSEFVGGERGWIEPIVAGPDGAVYVMLGLTVDDDNDNRTHFDYVVRLDVTG